MMLKSVWLLLPVTEAQNNALDEGTTRGEDLVSSCATYKHVCSTQS